MFFSRLNSKKSIHIWLPFLMLNLVWSLASCSVNKKYTISSIQGDRIEIDERWDAEPSKLATDLLSPYKKGIDSVMNRVIGHSARTLEKYKPESPLSNLVADVLRNAATEVLGYPADIGLMNMGGIRNILPAGDITTRTIFEILPFENSLCILKIEGRYIKQLMQNIANVKGEGVSNINLVVSDGVIKSALVNGAEIEDNRIYTVATIDYIADGNDGMTALLRAKDRICPEGAILRNLFLDYVKQLTSKGDVVDAAIANRIIIK